MIAAELYKKAAVPLEKAISADERRDYKTAKRHYSRACELLLVGIRMDRQTRRRTQKISQVQDFLARAEKLEKLLEAQGKEKEKGKEKDSSEEEGARGFDKVAGMEHIKQSMREAVILPIYQPQLFTGKRKPWRGVLLFGPPGTGKSYIAQALSEEAKVEFFSISASDIMSKYQGESERAIKKLFERARKKRPCVIFIDEIDSIGASREGNKNETSSRVLTEILRQMDGVGVDMEGVTVVAATNHPEMIDSALRRRFEKRLYVPMPGLETRLTVLKLQFGTDPALHSLSKHAFLMLAKAMKGYSNSDITSVVNEALMIPIRRLLNATHFKEVTDYNLWDAIQRRSMTVLVPCSPTDRGAKKMRILDKGFPTKMLKVPPVTVKDVLEALDKIKPSVSEQEIKRHQEFAKEFAGKDFEKTMEDTKREEEQHRRKSSVSSRPRRRTQSRTKNNRVPVPG